MAAYVKKASLVPYVLTYQDTGKSLGQVANVAFQKYGAVVQTAMDCPISYIVSQQNESDWDFVKRLANSLGISLYPGVRYNGMQFSIGPSGKYFEEDSLIRLIGISKSIDELLDVKGNISADASSYQFYVEKFECSELDAIPGDHIGSYVIFKNQLINDGGMLVNHIYVKREADVMPLSSDAMKDCFASMVLGGTVKSVNGNTIQVTLDNGAAGLGSGCVDVPYESALSNSFYVMPDVGDKVFLYYENNGSIVCLGSKRSNTDGPDFQTPDEKVLNNKDQMLRFTETSVTITNTRQKYDDEDTTQISVIMDDEEGIIITSGNDVVVETTQDGVITLATSTEDSYLQDMQTSFQAAKAKFSGIYDKDNALYVSEGGMSAADIKKAANSEEWNRVWASVGKSFVGVWEEISMKELRDLTGNIMDKLMGNPAPATVEEAAPEQEPYVDGVITIYGLNSVTLQVGESVIVIDSDVYFGADVFSWLGYVSFTHDPVVEQYQDWFDVILDGVQLVLDIAGLIPCFGFIPDLINAGISLARGDVGGALVSLFCAIPFVGDAAGVAKLGIKGAKALAVATKVIPKVSKVIKCVQLIYAGISAINSAAQIANAINYFIDKGGIDWTSAEDWKKLIAIARSGVGIAGFVKNTGKDLKELNDSMQSGDGNSNNSSDGGDGNTNTSDGGDGADGNANKPSDGGDGADGTANKPSDGGDGGDGTANKPSDGGDGGDGTKTNDGNSTDADGSTTAGDPINMATGSLTAEQVDLSFEDVLGTYSLRRVYESVYDNRGGILGNKWRFEIESSVQVEGDTATLQMPDLHLEHFEKIDGVWKNQRTGDEKLVFEETEEGYSLTIQDKATVYEYDLRGNLSAIFDVHGNKTSFEYAGKRLTKITLASGLWMQFNYAGGLLSKVEDSLGRTVFYEYTGDYLTSVKIPNGGHMRYEYTQEGYVTLMTDLDGKWLSKNYYDRKGRVIRQELAGGEEFVAFYDEKNHQNTFLTTSTGENVIYQYNNDNLITQAIYPDRTAEIKKYDGAQHVTYFKDRLGRESFTEYNAAGLKIYEKNPEGLETWYEYNALNLPEHIRNSAGKEWLRKFDPAGNLLESSRRISDKEWETTSYTYDAKGRVLTKTDANGNVHTYKYENGFSRPTQYVKPDGAIIYYAYNEAGQVKEERDAYGVTTYGHNIMGHLTYLQDAEGNVTKYEYDSRANLTRVTLPMESGKSGEEGAGTRYVYDEWTHLTQMVTAEFGVWTYENDYLGNIKRVKNPKETYDANAQGTRIEYDENHHRTKTIYADGSVLLEKYDVAGNLISKILPEQAEQGKEGWQYEYDAMNRLKEIRNPKGEVEKRIVYDLNGNMVKEITAKGWLSASNDEARIGTLYEYDLLGRLLKLRIPVEITETGETLYRLKTFAYDAMGNRVCEKNFLDYQTLESERGRVNVIHYRYDVMNRLVSVTDSTGANVEYAYNERGLRTREKRLIAEGVWQEKLFEYSASGRMTCVKTSADKDGSGKEFAATSYVYDKNGNLTKIQLPAGGEILREYDVMNRLVAETYHEPSGTIDNRTEYKYDLCGNLTEVLCADGYKKTYQYDALNRRIQSEDSLGAVEKYAYDHNGELTNRIQATELAQKGTQAKGWQMARDLLGRTVATYAPDGSLWHEVQYNQCGEKDYEGDATGGVHFTYDFGGRRIAVRSKAGSRQEYRYDAVGNLVGITDGVGASTTYETDLWGRITQVRRADGGVENYSYDYVGNVISAIDGLNHEVTYRYNSMNRLASRKDAAGAEERFAYDLAGNLVWHVDRNNKTKSWQYNMIGAPTLHRNGDGKISESYQYDKLGRLSSAIGGGMRYEYRYLPGGKLKEKLASGRTLLSYAYDLDGRKIKRSDLSGKETDYQYDLAGNLAEVREGGRVLAEYGYQGTKPTSVNFGNGKFTTTYEYDLDGNVVGLRSGDGTNKWVDNAYQYNGNGDVVARQGLDGQTAYAYDPCRRLVRVEYPHGVESFTYDLAGNRTSRTMGDVTEQYRYDNCNRLTEMTRTTGASQIVHQYDYDKQGNMILDQSKQFDVKGNLLQSEESRFDYDAFNRLESVSKDGKEVQRNRYDAEGLRHEMEENGELVKFLYNEGRKVVAEESAEGKLRRYVRGLGIICSDSEESKTYYHYVSDEHGSTTHIVDDDGNVRNQYEYDAFGNLTQCTEQVPNRFLYNGEMFDAATGQYYLRARFYNPVIARFTQEDTYYGDGLNLYEYCKSNPYAYADPTGHSAEAVNDPYKKWTDAGADPETAQLATEIYPDAESIRPEYQKYRREGFTPEESLRLARDEIINGRDHAETSAIQMLLDKDRYADRYTSSFGEMSPDDAYRYNAYWKYQEACEKGMFKNGSIYDGWYKPDGKPNYPDNYGAIPGTSDTVTLGGDGGVNTVDRFGTPKDTSNFVTESGVPADRLSLPPWTSPDEHFTYHINEPIPGVRRSAVAPWVGDRGLGIQYELPKPINWYIEQGIITVE